MDDDVADLVSSEIRNFYTSITNPFLDGLSERDRHNALSWGQRLMDMNNYPLMKNYLILLAYMIVSGRVVSPFDVDSRHCKLPKIPAEFQENKLFKYVREEIEHVKRKDLVQATESALSRDEMAFLAQLPAPNGGIRLYLALSDTPYNEWSRVNKFPVPTKYDISAKDFTDEGLELVKKKFNSANGMLEGTSIDEKRSNKVPSEQRNRITDTNDEKWQNQFLAEPENVGNSSKKLNDTKGTGRQFEDTRSNRRQLEDSRRSNGRQNNSSAYEYDSLLNSPATKEPRVQIIGLKKPEVYKCEIEVPPNNKAIIEEIADVAVDDLPDSPPSLLTEEDFQKEKKVKEKVDRWFGSSKYYRYRLTIQKLLRRKIPIDTIRRNIHHCMRQRLEPGDQIPNWLRDSLDESEPFNVRIAHLKMRFSDVLRNEYGVMDDDELFHLSNVPALSEDDECKVRELIRRAEEGRVHPDVRRLFTPNENRSCKQLMRLLDEILAKDYDPDAPPTREAPASAATPADRSVSPDAADARRENGERKWWPCQSTNMETSHSISRKSQSHATARSASENEATAALRRSFGHRGNNCPAERDATCGQPSNVCCPSGFRLEPSQSRQTSTGRSSSRAAVKEERSPASQVLDLSDNSQLEDLNLADERPDELFARLPPDSSIEDSTSNNRSRTSDKSSENYSK